MLKSSRIRLHWIRMMKAHYHEPNRLQTEKIMNQTISSHSETSTKIRSWENPEFPSHERKHFLTIPQQTSVYCSRDDGVGNYISVRRANDRTIVKIRISLQKITPFPILSKKKYVCARTCVCDRLRTSASLPHKQAIYIYIHIYVYMYMNIITGYACV